MYSQRYNQVVEPNHYELSKCDEVGWIADTKLRHHDGVSPVRQGVARPIDSTPNPRGVDSRRKFETRRRFAKAEWFMMWYTIVLVDSCSRYHWILVRIAIAYVLLSDSE
jgi:hypothetical protein